jgi:hypothetical protein
MIRYLAPSLAMTAVIALASCDSRPPTAPTVAETSAPAIAGEFQFSKPDPSAPIVIEKGELDFDVRRNGQLNIEGNRGFSLSAIVSKDGGIFTPYRACQYSNCIPGTPIGLSAFWMGLDLSATVTLDGTTYTAVGSAGVHSSASIQFLGTAVAPPLTKRGEDQITAPFTMTGQFHAQNGVTVSESFSGAGIAELWLVRYPAAGPGWFVERVLYRFKHPNASTHDGPQ